MSELIEIDPKTGNQELVATGTMDRMTETAAEMIEQAEDDRYDIPWIRIQPAQ